METVIQELKSIGLSSYASQAYAALLKHGALTPMQVAKIAKIPGPRVYDILRKLESMGFVVKESKRREPRYSATSVKAALEGYGRELAAGHRDKEGCIKKVSAKLAKKIAPVVSTEEVAYILDSDQMNEWVLRNIDIVKKRIWGIGSLIKGPRGTLYKIFPNIIKPFSDLKKKRVGLKFLVNVTNDNLRIFEKMAKYAEIRHWGRAPDLALYAVDGKEVLLSVAAPKTGTFDTGILIKDLGMVKVFEDYFNSKFKEGIPLEERIRELSETF